MACSPSRGSGRSKRTLASHGRGLSDGRRAARPSARERALPHRGSGGRQQGRLGARESARERTRRCCGRPRRVRPPATLTLCAPHNGARRPAAKCVSARSGLQLPEAPAARPKRPHPRRGHFDLPVWAADEAGPAGRGLAAAQRDQDGTPSPLNE
ncbi:translation initiation factor IF-2-like isoform X2 [Sciurus carolinensis]|uniref:translation initiation factor IF-2-like isoform X2 n=1 Tax=Sciurus carolinensis TaxID=30640 RepID=UPI001FB26BB8|nr:translation initiation factor IF-2-like isoform X2 [Sciurus carolinensis]